MAASDICANWGAPWVVSQFEFSDPSRMALIGVGWISWSSPTPSLALRKAPSSSAYHEEYAVATKRAADALRANDGQEEERVADIVRRIKEIFGTTGQPWNA